MKTFPKHEIAKLKLQISTIVGQAEVKLSCPPQDPIPMVYIPVARETNAANISKENVYVPSNENQSVATNAVLIITKTEPNEDVHDLTMDD